MSVMILFDCYPTPEGQSAATELDLYTQVWARFYRYSL